MLTLIEKVIFLKEVPFFQGMSTKELRILGGIAEVISCENGQQVITQGAQGDTLYVVVSGRVAIQARGKRAGSISRLGTLGPKEYFAETSIFDDEPHQADVIALETTDLLLVRRDTLMTLIRRHPELALTLLKALSQRLSQSQATLVERTRAKPKQLVDLYDQFDS